MAGSDDPAWAPGKAKGHRGPPIARSRGRAAYEGWDPGHLSLPDDLRSCGAAGDAGVGAGVSRGGSAGGAGSGFTADAAGALSRAEGDAEDQSAVEVAGVGGDHSERLRGGVFGAGGPIW